MTEQLDEITAQRDRLIAILTPIAAMFGLDNGDHVDELPMLIEAHLRDDRATVAQLALAVDARRRLFGLSARLMSQLSWCAGYLASDDNPLPEALIATLDEALQILPTIGNDDS